MGTVKDSGGDLHAVSGCWGEVSDLLPEFSFECGGSFARPSTAQASNALQLGARSRSTLLSSPGQPAAFFRRSAAPAAKPAGNNRSHRAQSDAGLLYTD